MKAKLFFVFTIVALLPTVGLASSQATLTPSAVKEDLALLYQGLQDSTYDLYAHTDKATYDQAYASLVTQIDRPMTERQVNALVMRFVALANIAHVRAELPMTMLTDYVNNDGRLLPISVQFDGEQLQVHDYLGHDNHVVIGDQIVAVNGVAVNHWLAPILSLIAADNDQLAGSILERLFTLLVWLNDGEQDHYLLTLKRGDQLFDSRVSTVPWHQQKSRRPQATNTTRPREYRLLSSGVGYLKPGAFSNLQAKTAVDSYNSASFISFIDQAFAWFKQQSLTSLVIDLRDNAGGDNSFSDYMVSYIADKPFRFNSSFRVRVSDYARQANDRRIEGGQANETSLQLKALYDQHSNGEVVSLPMPMVKPLKHDNRLDGLTVYALVDQSSYSNAVTTAAMLQDYGFATIIGKPTADLATTYAAVETFELPNTGVSVGFAKAFMIRPNGSEALQGVMPDIKLVIDDEQTLWQQLQSVID